MNTPFQTIYGSLMQHRAEHDALLDAMHAKPYLAPPQAPVLYIKPSNTFNDGTSALKMPSDQPLFARACLGLIFKQNWPLALIECASSAIDLIVNEHSDLGMFTDFSQPHSSFYRPPVKFNAFDGSLALPLNTAPLNDGAQLDALEIQTWVNGQLVHRYSSDGWLHSAVEQLHAVHPFIAFEAGDVLMMGCPPDAPRVKSGDTVQSRCVMAGVALRSVSITLASAS